MACMFDFI